MFLKQMRQIALNDLVPQMRNHSLAGAKSMQNKLPIFSRPSKGFTMIELVMVMVLVGILAVAVIPRFANKSAFDERGFFDQTITMVRYAQKIAIAQHTNVFVNITSNTICLTYTVDIPCTNLAAANHVINPADQAWFTKDATTLKQAGGTFGATTSFSFSALGKPSTAAVINVNAVSATQTITVERDTGYVH